MSRETKAELAQQVIDLARAGEAANDAFDEVACQKLGINRTDARCLNVIQGQGPLTAGRLAELSGLTTAAVTAVLDRLERAGYARRARDEHDRRRVNVEITPLMMERGAHIWGPLAEEAMTAFGHMTVAELKSLIAYFELHRDLNLRHVERVRALDFDE